jgi:hypothetical protein
MDQARRGNDSWVKSPNSGHLWQFDSRSLSPDNIEDWRWNPGDNEQGSAKMLGSILIEEP